MADVGITVTFGDVSPKSISFKDYRVAYDAVALMTNNKQHDYDAYHTKAAYLLQKHGVLDLESAKETVDAIASYSQRPRGTDNRYVFSSLVGVLTHNRIIASLSNLLIDYIDDLGLLGNPLRTRLSAAWEGFSSSMQRDEAIAVIEQLQRLSPIGELAKEMAVDHWYSCLGELGKDRVESTTPVSLIDDQSLYQKRLSLAKKVCSSLKF